MLRNGGRKGFDLIRSPMAIQGAEAISEEIFEEKAPYLIPTAEDETDAPCARRLSRTERCGPLEVILLSGKHPSRDDFQGRNLVAVEFEEETKVDRAAGEVSR